MTQHKKFWYSINMSNPQQNDIKNEIEQIKRIINLLQDRLQLNLLQLKRSKKKKILQNGQKPIAKLQTKKKTKLTKANRKKAKSL